MLSKLPDEILIEILQYLSPSFISCSARRVCRALHHVSKDRMLWTMILSHRGDYVLSSVEDSATGQELESQLVRAEAVKAVWTGKRPGVPCRVLEHNTIDRNHQFLGLIGSYAVYDFKSWMFILVDNHGKSVVDPTYFLYDIEPERNGKTRLAFKYVLTSSLTFPQKQDIGGWRFHIMRDISSLYILYSQLERPSEEEGSVSLKLVSITPKATETETFAVETKLSYRINNRELAEAARWIQDHSTLGPTTGCDYIALQDPRDDSLPIHLISISTGKTVLCPHHSQKPKGSISLIEILIKLTPRYLVQLKNQLLELFPLPSTEELAGAGENLWTSRTYTVTLSFLPTRLIRDSDFELIPISGTAFLARLCRDSQKRIRIFYFDTQSGDNRERVDVPLYVLVGERDDRYNDEFMATQVTWTTSSALGVAFGNKRDGYCLQSFWLPAKHVLKGDNDVVTLSRLNLPDPINNTSRELFKLSLGYVDPIFGRIAFLASSGFGGEEKLTIVSYVQ